VPHAAPTADRTPEYTDPTSQPDALADGAVAAREIAIEQEHLDLVYERLEHMRAGIVEVAQDGMRRATLGNEGALYERDVMVHQAARQLHALDAEYEGLVFGRLDLLPGPANPPADQRPTDQLVVRHVGRLGVRDADYAPLVVDWRAPAAAPFYQATPESPGAVVRRRVIHSRGRRVHDVSDDLLDPDRAPEWLPVIGEGALMAVLSRARGPAMRDIVSTIQREQDDAIRAPWSGVTTIIGGPGTGKTAVALHRVAYLLYRERRRFGGQILVVGPSTSFVNYVERVLPGLGEESVELRALGELMADVPVDQDGGGAVADHRDSAEVAAVKGSARMRRVLSRAARDTPPGGPSRLRVVYGGEVITLEGRRLTAARRAGLRRGQPNPSRPNAVPALVNALWEAACDALGPPPHWRREAFAEELADRNEVLRFAAEWWPVLTPAEVLRRLAEPGPLTRYAAGVLEPAEVAALAASLAGQGWSVEDIALLDELRVLLGRPPAAPSRTEETERAERAEMQELWVYSDRISAQPPAGPPPGEDEYALIVVDEAQDVSPMQWRMLGRRGRHASWTVVGDPAQSSWEDPAAAAEAREEAFGPGPRRDFRLTTNYRNSAEIFRYAAAVLRRAEPDAELPRAVRETGHDPVGHLVAPGEVAGEVAAAVAAQHAELAGTIGVVVPVGRTAAVRAALRPLPDGVSVVDALEAKGLEYDGVVVAEPERIAGESAAGVRVLYVALSRATQRLTVISTEEGWLAGPG
jgi:DNA helicase IV